MKNLLIHGVYLSVISVLSFLLYDKTKTDDFVFEKVSKALDNSNKHILNQIPFKIKKIKSNVDAQPRYLPYLLLANKACQTTFKIDSLTNILKQSNTLQPNSIQLLRTELKLASEQWLSSIIRFEDRKIISDNFTINKLIDDNDFWLKINRLTLKSQQNVLNKIQNTLAIDKMTILSYCEDMTSGHTILIFDGYRIAIAPKKASIIEGEKIEAEIYLAKYAKSSDNVISIEVNGKNLNLKEGVALFEYIPSKLGINSILAKINIKDPISNEINSLKGELRYEVLPKCSRDCAKNQ
jgi:hypothetical protein